MDTRKILVSFAEENKIDIEKVAEFMKRFEEPKTIEDLLKMPQDQLVHKRDIGFIPSVIEKFLEQYVCPQRHETVTIQKMVDTIARVRRQAHAEQDKRELGFMRKIEETILNEKYGSIKYDW